MTWDHFLNGFIADLPTLIAAIGAIIVAYVNRKHTLSNGTKIDQVRIAVNGRMESALKEIEALKSALAEVKGMTNG